MNRIPAFLKLLSRSRLSLLGAALVTASLIGDLILIVGETLVFESSPYVGILVYAVFPGIAVFGLLLIPVGLFGKARRLGAKKLADAVVVLRPADPKQVGLTLFGLTMANLVIFAAVGYRSFHFMESTEFCGELCHQPMHPELQVYRRSPHSEIHCVQCHVGSGAGWFIKSKLDGTRQLLGVLFDSYSRPIPTPLHNLRPARDVCEVCHRPDKFHGNLMRVHQSFAPDESNTRTFTILNMRIGGGDSAHREARGIHWHVSRDRHIRYYATDSRRENILRVEQVEESGVTRVWTRKGTESSRESIDPEEMRNMDCVDCHNRPTHIYLPPDQAIDEKLAEGAIDSSVPWIRKVSEEVITRDYRSDEEAMAGIAELPEIYRERYPEYWGTHREGVRAAVPVLQELHLLYVHPEMNIRWNTYPSLLGHPTSATSACFRCHDGLLQDENGETITNECDACHYVLADEERDPLVLRVLEDR